MGEAGGAEGRKRLRGHVAVHLVTGEAVHAGKAKEVTTTEHGVEIRSEISGTMQLIPWAQVKEIVVSTD